MSSSRSTTRRPRRMAWWRHARQSPDRPAARNTAILRYALFGDIQPCHHLIRDTSSEASLRPGRSISCNCRQHENGSPDSFQTSRCGYPSAFFNRLCQHGVDQFDDRRTSSLSSRSSVSGSSSARVKKPRQNRDLPSAGEPRKSPAASGIQSLFKFGLVDLPQRKGRVSPRCSSCKTESDNG